MKRFILLIACIVFAITKAQAQDTIVTIAQVNSSIGHQVHVCANQYDRVLVYAPEGCTDIRWYTPEEIIYDDNPMIFYGSTANEYHYGFAGCGYSYFNFGVYFDESSVPTSTIDTIWVRAGELAALSAVGSDSASMYNFQWNSGENTNDINKPGGTYICAITDGCDVSYRTKVVLENVELYRATVDLETNLNKATWQVTAEQSEYISEVKIYRDGLLVGTAPYEDGYYLDAIGSDNAARNYQIVGVTPEGEDCPIASYEKGTIHTTYYEDVNHNLNMTWNVPYVEEGAQGTLTYFHICKYDSNTGEITVVDQVNASITDYTCGVNQFDGGQAVIAAVFNNNKGLEELSFSNLTTDILGIEEDGPSTGSGTLTVYPNPAKDRVTIEGMGTAIITNALGQIVLTKEIDGKTTIELPQGLYFVKMNGVTRKVVVE